MGRLLIGCIAAALCSLPLMAREMTLTETVTLQSVSSAILSPTQQTVAFTRNLPRTPYQDEDGSDRSALVVIDEQGNEVSFVQDDAGVAQVAFAPQGDRIFFLSKRDGDKQRSLYTISVSGGEAKKLFEFDTTIRAYAISANGEQLAFLAQEPDPTSVKKLADKGFKAEVYEEQQKFTNVYLLDLTADELSAQRLTDEREVFSVAFRPEHEQLLVRTAPTGLVDDNYMSSSYELLSTTGEFLHTYDSTGKLGYAEFSPNGRYLAVIGAADYNDPATGRLFVYDSQAEHERREVLPEYQGHVKDIAWRTNEELIWLGHIGTESEVRALTMQWLESRQLVEPGQLIVVDVVAAAGKSEVLLRAHTASHPTELYQHNRNGLQRLTDSNPWLAEITLPEQQSITYKASDGVELQGILVYPVDYQQGQRYPLIMVVHGGPESHYSNGWLDRYASPAKHAAAKGYAVFFPNYRGSTGRGVEFSKLGQDDYAGKEFDDLVDGKNHLISMGLVDEAKVGITGGSYGGYASAWAATALTDHFAASVMSVGISNNLSKFGTTDIPKEMHAVHARSYPWDKWQWYLERSPIYHAEKGRTPLLIMHGKEDTRVHPSQSMELYRYLKTHGKVPVRLVLYPGEGHGNRKAAAQLDFSMRLMRWMDKFLVEQATALPPYELEHADNLPASNNE